jgi:hypothetical protein
MKDPDLQSRRGASQPKIPDQMGRTGGFFPFSWRVSAPPVILTLAPHLVLIYPHHICLSGFFLYVSARCRTASREAVDIYGWWWSIQQFARNEPNLDKAFSRCQGSLFK